MYTGVQNAIKNSKTLQDKLSNPNLTREQKNQLLIKIASSVAKELNIDTSKIDTISTDTKTKDGDEIKGGYHRQSGDIVINDKNIDNTGEALNTLGHELTHSMDDQRGTQRSEASSDEYANIMGSGMEDYAGFAMWNYSDGKTLADSNSHNGLNPSTDNSVANSVFGTRVRNNEVEFRSPRNIQTSPIQRIRNRTAENLLKQLKDTNSRYSDGVVRSGNSQINWTEREIVRLQNEVNKINKNDTPPINLSPQGAGRRGAFREAKRDSNIPMIEHPKSITTNETRSGKPQKGRVYKFDLEPNPNVRIREDSGGHNYGKGNSQNRGSHFNTVIENKETREYKETGNHYDYK